MRKMLLALVLVLVVSSFAFAADIDSALTSAMKDSNGLIPVIVQMNPGAKQLDAGTMGGKHGHNFSIIHGFSAELPAAAIEALAKNPNVYAITLDKEVQVNLNVAVPTVNSDDLWNEGYTGQGVTIAIVDTGIYPHQDFQNRIVGFKDFVGGKTAAYDDNGHGTHCAGIAAGNGATYDGPSRDANLVGVKVLDRRGSGSLSTVIQGVEWCVTNKATYSIDIISMSLGATVTQSSKTDPVCEAVRNAWNAGIVVVVAAGNEGPSSYTIGTPGNEPLVITVAASADNGTVSISDDFIASFSSRGPTYIDGWAKPDIAAPGASITACDNRSTGYVTMSGTSMATPLMAGIIGQYLEANPSASPNSVKTAVKGAGRLLSGYNSYAQGAGLIDAYALVH